MSEANPTASPRVKETRQRILQAALQEFSTHGYMGATTRTIADKAVVSELTLFRHFQTKKNLFLAVISQFSAIPGIQLAIQEKITGNIRQDLLLIGETFYQTIIIRRKEILMTLREAEMIPEVREAIGKIPDLIRNMVAGYLRQQMDAGRIKRIDPELAAQAFLGMFLSYSIFLSLNPANPSGQFEEIVTLFVDIFLKGVIRSNEE